jgi:mono/diheme cytochrome c family protein
VYQTDKKVFGNIEHQRSGLDWNLDNWLYVTIDPVRFRYRSGQLAVDSLVSGSNGQWGLTHDDYGRLYFSRAASSAVASGFQINPAYGQLDMADATDADFAKVWPIIKTPDVNGGPKTLREDSTMFGFTSVCGQSVFRGDRLPKSLAGDYLAAEPVGRFIRRAKITDQDGKITLANAYQEEEFISSTDMNFRPINTYTGPDGCLYIVDMYRGIIQESTWAQPGSYLYSQIMSKGLDKNIRRGRIYRLVYDGIPPGPQPRMLDEPVSKLVTYLDHPNGWWRDNAQKEIIVRGEPTVVPALNQIAQGKKGPLAAKPSPLARLHALWTLEGLAALDQETLLAALQDQDGQVRKAAVRISEQFLQQEDQAVVNALKALAQDPSLDVRAQLLLSLSTATSPQAAELSQRVLAQEPENELLAGVQESLRKNEEVKKYGYKLMALAEPARRSVIEGAGIFRSICSACHGPEGLGLASKVAPPLVGKFKLIEQKDGVIKIMLHGLAGPVDGEQYADHMPPMGSNSDEWIAAVLNYVRYDLSMKSFPKMNDGYNNWVIVTPEQVKKVREAHASRTTPWTWQEIRSQAGRN